MTSQNGVSTSNSNAAAWEKLGQRQEVLLSQLDQLSVRVEELTSPATDEVSVVTSSIQPTPTNAGSSTTTTTTTTTTATKATTSNTNNNALKHSKSRSVPEHGRLTAPTSSHNHKSRMSSRDFSKLNESQYALLDRLLNAAHTINTVSQNQNLQLTQAQDIENSIRPIADMIDERLSKVSKKAQFLLDLSRQQPNALNNGSVSALHTQHHHAEMTPDSVRSQGTTGTPVFHPKRKLSSAGLEPMRILPFHNEPKESESEEFMRRMGELEYSVNHLKSMLAPLDLSETGLVAVKDIYRALSNMNLEMTLAQAMHSRHIALIIKSLSSRDEDNDGVDTMNKKIDYLELCAMTLDVNRSDRGEHKHEWHHLRRRLIGKERKEGCLRIKYRFDGWPYPLTARLFHSLDTKSNKVMPKDIAHAVQLAMKEHVEFEKIAYAEKSKHGIGKTSWIKIEKSDAVPLHVERDGWLEVDVWLKTKEFLTKQPGRPLPKYA